MEPCLYYNHSLRSPSRIIKIHSLPTDVSTPPPRIRRTGLNPLLPIGFCSKSHFCSLRHLASGAGTYSRSSAGLIFPTRMVLDLVHERWRA